MERLLFMLLRHADDTGTIECSGRSLAHATGLSHKRVRTLMDRLVQADILILETSSTGSLCRFTSSLNFLEIAPMSNVVSFPSPTASTESIDSPADSALRLVHEWNSVVGRSRPWLSNELEDQRALLMLLNDGTPEEEVREVIHYIGENELQQYCNRPLGLIKPLRQESTGCRYDHFLSKMRGTQKIEAGRKEGQHGPHKQTLTASERRRERSRQSFDNLAANHANRHTQIDDGRAGPRLATDGGR
jgi:hypothetical protein